MAVLGVDGWRGRWVGALLDDRHVTLLDLPDVAAVLAVPDVVVIAIDMPIGLSDGRPRRCDVEARRLLGPARSSVFPAPLRAVLGCGDYAEACAVSRQRSGKALSRQAWGLVPAIRSVDEALDRSGGRVHEVHPELAFRALDERVRDRKATARGQGQRLRALASAMDVLDALAQAPPGVPQVDALDACAAAWSARRIAEGRALSVEDEDPDSRGRPMRISW